jgi:hypothetical protein
MSFRGGEFSTGEMGNFNPALTLHRSIPHEAVERAEFASRLVRMRKCL